MNTGRNNGKWCCQHSYLKIVLSRSCHEIRPMYNAKLSTKTLKKIHPDTRSLFLMAKLNKSVKSHAP